MFFCPKCDNNFDITHTSLKISDYNKFKTKYEYLIKNDDINMDNIEDLKNNDTFKNLPESEQSIISKEIDNILSTDSSASFICNNCKLYESIKPDTLIFSKTSGLSNNYMSSNYKNMIHNDTLPLTRAYTCSNDKCDSHTDFSKRSAKFFRKNNSFELVYICTSCNTIMGN